MSDLDILDAEVVEDTGTALAVSEYRPQMVLSPADAKALAQRVKETTLAVLEENVDYGVIPGTNKPSLLKPGAEKLLQWFGLGHRMEPEGGIIERDPDGKRIGVTYHCIVTKPLPDREVIVASGDGYAGHDESKWKNAPWNTVVQMACKRALVAATLRATGTSGLLTSDMEDTRPDYGAIVAQVKDRARALPPDGQEHMRQYLKAAGRLELMDAAALAAALVEIGKQTGKEGSTRTEEEPPNGRSEVVTSGDGGGNNGPAPAAARLTDKQRAGIMAHLGGMERDARLARLTELVGREVASTNDLTKDEAGRVLDALGAGG